LAAEAKLSYEDGMFTVKIGSVMEDWQKWELIKRFRDEFKSDTQTVLEVSYPNGHFKSYSGTSEIRTRI